jgi:hypothetical protein
MYTCELTRSRSFRIGRFSMFIVINIADLTLIQILQGSNCFRIDRGVAFTHTSRFARV